MKHRNLLSLLVLLGLFVGFCFRAAGAGGNPGSSALAPNFVDPGTDLAPLAIKGGHYWLVPHAGRDGIPPYYLKGSPTIKVDDTAFIGDDTEVQLVPAPGASSAIVDAATGTEFHRIRFTGLGLLRETGKVRGPSTPTTQPIAPPDPAKEPAPTLIIKCDFAPTMVEGIHVQGTHQNLAVVDTHIGRTGGCNIYDCGANSVFAFVKCDGSQGEHPYRAETDGGDNQASGSVLAYCNFDNRLSPTGKEDVTFRQGRYGYLIGSYLHTWMNVTGQGSTVISRNVFLGLRKGGARIQERPAIGRAIFLDHNWFPASTTDVQVSMFQSGDLLLNMNTLYDVGPVYKQAFVNDPTTPFKGRIIDLRNQTLLVPSTQPVK